MIYLPLSCLQPHSMLSRFIFIFLHVAARRLADATPANVYGYYSQASATQE